MDPSGKNETGMDTTSKLGNAVDNKNEIKKRRNDRSTDESGLGKSVDSGLGKSLDKQDVTMGDNRHKEGDGGILETMVMSQDEPTVINETQISGQGAEENNTKIGAKVSSKLNRQEPTVSVDAKNPSVGIHARMDDKAEADDEGDRSSGPFKKTTESVSEKKTTKVSLVVKKSKKETLSHVWTKREMI